MPLKFVLGADGELDGNASRPKISWMLSRVRWKSARSRSSLLMTNARGSLIIFGERPDLFGLDLDAGDAIHHDQRGIGRDAGMRACH